MNLKKLSPALCAIALLAGSAAFAQAVDFRYGVSGGASTLLSAPAACGSVITSPAVVAPSGCATFTPAAIDPFAPLWRQAVVDYSGLPAWAVFQPVAVRTNVIQNSAVILNGSGACMP